MNYSVNNQGVVCVIVDPVAKKIVDRKASSDIEAKLKRALPRKVRVAKPVHNY